MRLAFIVAAALLTLVAPASAATPVAPVSGSSFTTTDTVTFEAQPAPEEADYTFVFADAEPATTASRCSLLAVTVTSSDWPWGGRR